MFYKGRDTQKEKIVLQKKYQTAFRILNEPDGLLYHYAGIETIWKILESDSFLARNIRFSNDSEEYKLGEKKIKEYTEKFFSEQQQRLFKTKLQQGIQMFYMICFCKEGDLLSQWRGYAKDGVSLGMDFNEEDLMPQTHTEMFTVLNNEKNQEEDRYKLNDNYVRFVEMPYQVFYVPRDEEGNKDLMEAVESFDDKDAQANLLLSLIPFIKDEGFAEETEYRILFDISDLGETEAQNRRIMSKKIQYTERDNRKLPNILVEVGDAEKKCDEVREVILGEGIRIKAKENGISEQEIDKIYQSLGTELKKFNVAVQNVNTKQGIYIGEGNNQEKIMGCIEDTFQKKGLPIDYDNGIKIWCRGHLPIRKVIVGPGEKKEKIKESLKHYMGNTYWLRYVEVVDSNIPLQT